MPAWNELQDELNKKSDEEKNKWLIEKQYEIIKQISVLRESRNVIFYASSFLQKPQAPAFMTQVSPEDINGFMAVMCGMNWKKGLTLILHTPGGITTAAETIGEYLLNKFDDIEVIIPTYSMSAGTMLSFISQKIIMGKQSQLGPIDPQMPIGNRYVSARAIVDQFKIAKEEISSNTNLAHVWLPILQSFSPALLKEANNALDYGEKIAARWLSQRMFKNDTTPKQKADSVANYFNKSEEHKSHGRRIDREEARSVKLSIDDLEDNQDLQEAILTLYHLVTIVFDKSPAVKLLTSSSKRLWIKNVSVQKAKG